MHLRIPSITRAEKLNITAACQSGADPGFLKGGVIGLGLGTHATPWHCVFALLWANNNFIFGSKQQQTLTDQEKLSLLEHSFVPPRGYT